MSVVSYQNNGGTGQNLSVAAALLLVASTNLSYADEIFTDNDFPSAFVKTSEPLNFDLELSSINEFLSAENSENLHDIDVEIMIDLKMPPIKEYSKKAKITKKVHATPRINITELV